VLLLVRIPLKDRVQATLPTPSITG
jgi:hypothetical protein